MGKINLLVKYCLINQKKEYNIKGIYQNNIIKFKDDNVINIIDLKNNIMERIYDNQTIRFDFNNNICYIEADNIVLDLEIKVLEIKSLNDYFYVKYNIDNDYYEIEIKII